MAALNELHTRLTTKIDLREAIISKLLPVMQGQLRTRHESLTSAIGALISEHERITKDPHLTEAGKRDQLAKVATKTANDLAVRGLDSAAGETGTVKTRLEKLLFTPQDPQGDPMMNYLREREIRDMFRGKPQQDIDAAYVQALKRGDEETRRALFNPPGGPLVTPDIRIRVEHEHAKTTNPMEYQKLESVTVLQTVFSALADHTAQALKSMGANLESQGNGGAHV